MKASRVAIVYDRVNKWGGAERVLLTLHELFPEAPLYTSVYDPSGAPWAKVFPKIYTSFLQKIPLASRNHEYLAMLMPSAFESFDFSGYDLVISVSSEASKGVITKGDTIHLNYCLTPTRYLWSGYSEYFRNQTLKRFSLPLVNYLRQWDKMASHRPDKMIGISQAVKSRIKKYYGREVEIVFPPVDTFKFRTRSKNKNKRYFLLVSRLVSYKKVDLAILAFNKLRLPLIIVGDGREKKKLKAISNKNIKFVGKVTDKKLKNYYENATALIFPQKEDFGLVAVEAQAMGIPVVAYSKGGAIDTVIEGKTGVFFEKQTVESLVQAVKLIKKIRFDQKDIVENAQRFSKERFMKEFARIITNI